MMKRKLLLAIYFMFSLSMTGYAANVFKTKELKPGIKAYIQETYQIPQNKKMVLYEPSFLSANCPYIQVFVKEFNKQRNRKDLTSYAFQKQTLETPAFNTQEEVDQAGKKMMAFLKECGAVCIISMKNNWMYSISYPGVNDALTLQQLFSFFKNKK